MNENYILTQNSIIKRNLHSDFVQDPCIKESDHVLSDNISISRGWLLLNRG